MLQQFKNMNDLVEYLTALEQRIGKLQSENSDLRAEINLMSHEREKITKYVERTMPQTNLVSGNFLKRAFAVWATFLLRT
jgi:predicted  nucleic acid-binding Zn-ribbon protein